MASRSLYAPGVNNYEPAFDYREDCKIKFKLSDYNAVEDVSYVHAVVTKSLTSENVINRELDKVEGNESLLRTSAGVILNLPIDTPETEEELLNANKGIYTVTIPVDCIKQFKDVSQVVDTEEKNNNEWQKGTVYKVQIRLVSTLDFNQELESKLTEEQKQDYNNGYCSAKEATTQNAWLNTWAGYFSEWSETIVIKATDKGEIVIPVLEPDKKTSDDDLYKEINFPNLDLIGSFVTEDDTEYVYSALLKLYDTNDELIETSKNIYTSKNDVNKRQFSYTFRYELEDNETYYVRVKIITENKMIVEKIYTLKTYFAESTENPVHLELDKNNLGYETNEACVILKITNPDDEDYRVAGDIRVRRTSQYSNFKIWEDITTITGNSSIPLSDYAPIVDFFIESGITYQYEIQIINYTEGGGKIYSLYNKTDKIKREFDFNYILGENHQQLKVLFNGDLSNYNKNVTDVVTPTIGSQFPFITRVGNSDYATFNYGGKISFQMDENHTFINKDFLYGYDNDTYIDPYDYTYEREFRNEVYKFLRNGKPKLFKSPTEGNLIVRLTNVTLSPEQSLGRLIYNFSATVTEIDTATLENYRKYNLLNYSFIKEED